MITLEVVITKYNWKVNVLFSMDCIKADSLNNILTSFNCTRKLKEEALSTFKNCQEDVGFTLSDISSRQSIIILGKFSSKNQLINTFIHEIIHLVLHITIVNNLNYEDLAVLGGSFAMLFTDALSDILSIK